ncbi:CopG family transcriptional regulator [Nocardia sp. CDC160]|uniref:ribbon-helix-helix domain-containing protein n=1 Tax=Nocardia sp. CDC160 TaxID=3112166 RepID=UPI002DBCD05A|nr:CopG family transcriptional regulator [Nocardia sp. CDC160]MEC3918635.1 CopG family transcriptional regulator [Nocardia sp. CDC160]
MRISVALDPDVVVLLEEAARRQRRSKRQVVNDALRQALSSDDGSLLVQPGIAQVEPDPTPAVETRDRRHSADLSDEEALRVALARIFGLELPTPRLYVVKSEPT